MAKIIQSLLKEQTPEADRFAKTVKQTPKKYTAETIIIARGQIYPYFLYIQTGVCRIVLHEYQEMGVNSNTVVDEINAGNLAGEMQLFNDKPSHLDVMTLTEANVIEIDKASFKAFLEEDPKFGYQVAVELLEHTVKIVEHMNKAATLLLKMNAMLQKKSM